MNKNEFYKKRKNIRKIMLEKNIEKNEQEKSTVEIYHEVFNKGYAYSIKTLEKDLEELEKQNKITKNTKYEGRGYGTRNFWKTKKNNKQ